MIRATTPEIEFISPYGVEKLKVRENYFRDYSNK